MIDTDEFFRTLLSSMIFCNLLFFFIKVMVLFRLIHSVFIFLQLLYTKFLFYTVIGNCNCIEKLIRFLCLSSNQQTY